jgi:hypothetical protein
VYSRSVPTQDSSPILADPEGADSPEAKISSPSSPSGTVSSTSTSSFASASPIYSKGKSVG